MIAIVDSGGANITSVLFALERLGYQAELTADPKIIQQASHVILPGVGAARDAMDKLQKSNLVEVIRNLTQPVLGICLGMQLLFEHSHEGEVDCLAIIPGTVDEMQHKPGMTVPHMGWNSLKLQRPDNPILAGIQEHDYVYFVHSYKVPVNPYTVASCEYDTEFSAMVNYKNFYATQFHPERSSAVGSTILGNFLRL